MGGCLSPFNSFELIQGLETLSLRCRAHCENANALARWLDAHAAVKRGSVTHPSLAAHPSHARAAQYFRPGCYGSVFVFELAGKTPDEERRRGKAFITALKMCARLANARRVGDEAEAPFPLLRCAHLANVGDARTLVIHPASTTHQQLSAEQQLAAGVKPAGVRVSVGYEDLDDIKLDFEQAFEAACAGWVDATCGPNCAPCPVL